MNHEMLVMGPLLGWLVCSIASVSCLLGFLVGWLVGWLAGWLVGWLVAWLHFNNQRNFGVKRLLEVPEPADSISLLCFNRTLSTCVPGAVNTAEVEKVGTELRALKEKLKQEAQGK